MPKVPGRGFGARIAANIQESGAEEIAAGDPRGDGMKDKGIAGIGGRHPSSLSVKR